MNIAADASFYVIFFVCLFFLEGVPLLVLVAFQNRNFVFPIFLKINVLKNSQS